MFCKSCGTQLNDGAKFCKNCGTAVTYVSEKKTEAENTVKFTPAEPQPPVQEVKQPVYVAPAQSVAPKAEPKKKKGTSPVLYVVLGIVTVLLIAAIVVLVMTINKKDNDDSNNGGVVEKEYEIFLAVDEYEEETEEKTCTLSGVISTEKEKATLSINGQKITTVSEDDGEKVWSKRVNLEEGTNSFDIVLYTKNNKKTETENVEIEYKKPLLYPEGTVLIKADPDGVNIRPTPEISEERVMLIPYDDFQSQFVCQGEEHLDDEEFIWCKVMTPDGKIGWVRSDLMKPIQ
ncbi:MAG: zinc ribbon domain-containing protein [Clostridia bacterium]|nr:zinc ribbon domain-containing protein [Clostridia bacterium]